MISDDVKQASPVIFVLVPLCRYLVGTEDGYVHRCLCTHTEQYLSTYKGHMVSFHAHDFSAKCSPLLVSVTVTELQLRLIGSATEVLRYTWYDKLCGLVGYHIGWSGGSRSEP